MDGNKNNTAWLVSFSDVITLLLTFFVLIISMSSMDDKSIKESFSYFDGKPGIFGDLEKGSSRIAYLKKKFNLTDSDVKNMLNIMSREKVTEEQAFKLLKLEKILGKDYKYKVNENDVILDIQSGKFFNRFDYSFSANGESELMKFPKLMNLYNDNCYISSFTSDFPVRTSKVKDNVDLSIKRLGVICKILTRNISPSRINIAGWGNNKLKANLIEIKLKNFIKIYNKEESNG